MGKWQDIITKLGDTRGMINQVSPWLKFFPVAGGSAGNITVTGIAVDDELLSVLEVDFTTPSITELKAEFSVTAANTINNTGGTDTSGNFLVVVYHDKTRS